MMNKIDEYKDKMNWDIWEDKMGWHYQARKKTYDGEVLYELVEAYPDLMEDGDTLIPHTVDAVSISSDSKEDLAKWLRKAADDVEKYDIIDGDK